MQDSKIIELLFARSERAIELLSLRFGKRLLATAVNILSNEEDAQESVSDTYLAVWNAIPPKQPDLLDGYVYKIGRNLALKKLRSVSAAKRDSRHDLSLDELIGCIPTSSLEDEINARQLGRAIDAFLETVSSKSRILFLRRYWFGDSVQSIARSLGMTESAVSVSLSRTRNALRIYLNKEGYLYE